MENISLAINIIAMLSGVVSAIVAVRAKNESKNILNQNQNILNQINQIKLDLDIRNIKDNNIENSGDFLVESKGDNNGGIVAGIISGGVNKSGNKKR